ncbi:Ig-like domain-containing protein, partial [Hirschia maritima]|uniref:Ig-like domain-containing protein n=1 Tax=Hirschia maritima TaxID=1121961 RepID=UPI000523FCD1
DDDVGDTLSITGVDSVSTNGASVALDSDGNVVYDPNGQFDLAEGQTTTDTFNYTVSDGNGGTDTAIATVTVTGRGDTSEPELPEEPTSYIPINGTSGGDHWIDQSGSQLYDGGDGWNSVEFAGTEEDYLFSYDEVKNEGIVLHIASGTYDRVRNINALRFTGDGSQYGKYRYFGLAQGTEGDDQEISIVGTHNAETIYGYGGNDIIEGGRGNDRLDGGSGWDRVNLDGVREDYEFIEHSNGVVVARNIHTGEQDALVNVEGIWFYGEQDDANLVDLITGTTQEPVPEYLNTPIEGNITTGGFQYPILIDLGGDGADLVSVTQSRIVFESDTGGPLMRMGWISAKDGMLVLDRDGDGIINKLSEISFVNDLEGAKTDLEGLRAYDTNFDGVFDAQDDSWALFQVWRDVNQNGIGRGSELASLEEMGISGIRLALTSVNESTDGYADSIVLNEASLITTDGVDRTIYDVALRGELAHVSGYVEGAVSPEWSTFSWTSDGAFGVAQSASNHSGDIEDLAELQTISSDSIWGQDIPLQDLVRYVDYNDELSIPDYLTFSDDDPLTPTFGVKPLVFDLDGNGLDLIDPGQSPIIRDMNGNGAEDRLGWIGSGDGLLALDRNGDGNIDPVSEISFVQDLEGAQTDLEGLVAYDTNNDGWFDADDAQFDQFQIWQDYNYNAISDEGELKSLFEAGIARISLTADESLGYQDSPLSNRVFGQAVFEWNDGTTGLFGDVELRGFSGSEIEQALERERRNNSINANDDIQARLEAMLEAQRRAEELVPNSGETSGVASASVSPESMLSAEDGSNPIERSHMSNINRLDKIAPEIKEGMPSIVQNDLQLTDIGESALSTNTPKRKWWKFGQRSDDVRSTPALGERLAKLDAEKQDIGVETNAQPTPTERQAGELAEKQRLMQAMASFKGSSGVPAVRKRDLDQDNSADIAVAKMNKKSGFGIRSLFN